jgi:hypothetical protein
MTPALIFSLAAQMDIKSGETYPGFWRLGEQ